MDEKIAFPGDRLATEEEYVPSKNVFVEKGNIYAYAVGKEGSAEGKLGLSNTYKEIRKIKRGMPVIGTVVGVLPSVVFIRIDSIRAGRVVYVPIKDGKIVTKSARPMHGGRPSFRDSRDRHESREESKMCGMGDLVIATVFRDDEDNYELSIRNPETGVILAKCETCGTNLKNLDNMLACPKCKHTESRKISSLYGNQSAITEFIKGS